MTLGVDEAGLGRPVLLWPALSSISTRREMHPLMQQLAADCHVIAVDWPGFGDHLRPAVAWTPNALSTFLNHYVREDLPSLHAMLAAEHVASYVLQLAARCLSALGRLALLVPTWRGPLPAMVGGDWPIFQKIRKTIGLPVVGPLLCRANGNRFVVPKMVDGHVYSGASVLSGDRLHQKRQVIDAPGAHFGSAALCDQRPRSDP